MGFLDYILYLAFALLPIFAWLAFYLSKDKHPEPKIAIIEVFLLGILVAAVACLVALGFLKLISVLLPNLDQQSWWFVAFRYFIIVALLEESAKYLIARNFITSSPNVDEPVDIMLYLVVCALGFAGLENLLLVFSANLPLQGIEIVQFSFLRFIGAVFLHTLASATLGYFVALSIYFSKHKFKIFFAGLFVAVFAHGLFDFALVKFSGPAVAWTEMAILLSLAIFTTWGFIKMRNTKSIGLVS